MGGSMRVTIKAVNQELAKRNIQATLANGGGYFLFRGPDVNSWLDRTVKVSKISDLTLDRWMQAFKDLKRKDQEIARAGTRGPQRRAGADRRSDG
jgi:hypothetical protein